MRTSFSRTKTAIALTAAVAMAALNLALAPFAAAISGPVITFSVSTADMIEDEGTLELTVELDVATDGDVLVDVDTGPVSALGGSDYTDLSTTVTILQGDTSATVDVTILDDSEGVTGESADETFTVTLSLARMEAGYVGGAAPILGAPSVVTVTIADDDVVAVDDTWDEIVPNLAYVTNKNVDLTVSAIDGVLANDIDRADADPGDVDNLVTGNSVASPSGTALANSDGSFEYEPATDFLGEATFTYDVSDGTDSDTATVAVRVNGPVVASADTYTFEEDVTVDTDADAENSLLDNDDNGEDTTIYEDALTITGFDVTSTEGGTVVVSANGHFTYTPAANFNGTDSFDYDVSDGFGSTETATATITVTAVNDDPTFSLTNQSLGEDPDPAAISVAAAGWITDILDGDPTASPTDDQSVDITIDSNDNNALFDVQPAVGEDNALTFAVAENANGVAVVTVTAADDGQTDDVDDFQDTTDTFTISIGAINDPPNVEVGEPISVDEDPVPAAQVISLAGWTASAPDDGDPEVGVDQELSYTIAGPIVDGTNPVTFAVAPAIDLTSGEITFTVDDDDHGSFTIPVTVTDTGLNTPAPNKNNATVNVGVTVNSINDEPIVDTRDVELDEDPDPAAQVISVAGWTTAAPDDGDPADTQVLSYILDSVVAGANALTFETAPAIDPIDGELTFQVSEHDSGSVTLTVTVTDDGATGGDNDNADTVTFDIILQSINDAPTFNVADQEVDEDGGAQLVNEADWLSDLLDGDPFENTEDDQAVTVALTGNSNPGLFSAAPALVVNDLTYTPADDANGTATITVTATDDNGTPGVPGDDLTHDETFDIVVNPVNDEPSFAFANPTVLEDSGETTLRSPRSSPVRPTNPARP